MTVMERLANSIVVPVVVIEDVKDAVPCAKAMAAGGVDTMEITFRTACAPEAIKAVAENCPDVLVGAGTIINVEQAKLAVEMGAKFIVSPGFSDEVAGIVAKRHSMSNVTTASVDNLTFLHGAYQNDMIVIRGKLTWVGTSSMEVCVDTYVETLDGQRDRINNAHFMMVALDENNKPVPVPKLILQTEDEHLAWAHGEERRRIRNQRRKDKLDGI